MNDACFWWNCPFGEKPLKHDFKPYFEGLKTSHFIENKQSLYILNIYFIFLRMKLWLNGMWWRVEWCLVWECGAFRWVWGIFGEWFGGPGRAKTSGAEGGAILYFIGLSEHLRRRVWSHMWWGWVSGEVNGWQLKDQLLEATKKTKKENLWTLLIMRIIRWLKT